MTKGEQIFQQAVASWASCHYGFDAWNRLCIFLGDAVEADNAKVHLMACLESMIVDERMKILNRHYDEVCGGVSNAKPEHYEPFETSPETRAKLNRIVEFYRVPRAFMYLYVHAKMYEALKYPNPIDRLDAIIADWS